MKYTLDIIQGTRIALFHWSGQITLDDRRKNRREIVEFCQKEGVRSVIIDGRDQESKTDTMDTFAFSEEMPEEMHKFRVAIVHSPGDDSLHFIYTVAANRGSFVKEFQSVDAARAWLESLDETPNKPDVDDA